MTFPRASLNHAPIDLADYREIRRYACVRLGPQFTLYENGSHGSVGIVDVRVENGDLVIETDFEDGVEIIQYVAATSDQTLSAKAVHAGGSGGGRITKYRIYSSKTLTVGSTSYPANSRIWPNSEVFDSLADNLWFEQVSLRPLSAPDPS